MSILKITWVAPEPNQWDGPNGTTYYYNVAGTFEGQDKKTSIGVKDQSRAPKPGDEVEGYFTTVDGKEKFKKVNPLSGPAKPQGYTPRPEDPERQDSIIRQSSFERAILIQAKKADILIAEKKLAEAHDAIKFKTITDLSDYIAEYAKGKLINAPKVTESDLHNFDDGPYSDEEE